MGEHKSLARRLWAMIASRRGAAADTLAFVGAMVILALALNAVGSQTSNATLRALHGGAASFLQRFGTDLKSDNSAGPAFSSLNAGGSQARSEVSSLFHSLTHNVESWVSSGSQPSS